MRLFKKRAQKRVSAVPDDKIILEVAEIDSNEKIPVKKENVNPYQSQIQLLYEKSLMEDPDLESAHNLSKWLLEHPEFLPDSSTE